MIDRHNILDVKDKFFIRLNHLILENIEDSDYSLDELCRNLLISRSQLHRKIKEVTGLSTTLYIRKYKLLKAKVLLQDSELKISEVAYAIGLNSPQAFSKYFSSEFGHTPSQFRSLLNNENPRTTSNHSLTEENSHPEDLESDPQEIASSNATPVILHVGSNIQSLDSRKPNEPFYIPLKLVALLIVSVLSLLTYRSFVSNKPIEPLKMSPQAFTNSIAVLPFSSLGGSESDQISGGIQEDILTNLSFYKDLKVISRTSSEAYRNTIKSALEIGRELGVKYMLEGSVQIHGNQISVTTQLINAIDDSHVWANKYVRDLDDIFKIQNEISIEVARVLNQKIVAATEEHISNSYEPGKEAYKLYLIGKELLKERTHSSLLGSIEHFNEAIALEPDYVGAIVLKANAYQLLGNIGYDRKQEHIASSEKYALEALKLAPTNGFAYALLACKYKDSYQWDQAKVTFEIALNHNPNNALINYWYSLLLREIGDTEQAVKFSSRAKELDPLYPVIHGGHIVNLAYSYRKDEAAAAIKAGDLLFKQSFLHHWAKAVYAESILDHNSAIKSFELVKELNPELTSVHKYILFNKARLGQKEEVLREIAKIKTKSPVDCFSLATLYAGLNNAELSAQYFLEAIAQGMFPSDILVDRNYDVIREVEAYKQILDQYNLTSFAKEMKK